MADVNGDGKADLIYSYSAAVYQTNTYEQGIAIQLSNGDGTFQAPQVIQTYSSTTAPTGQPPQVVQIGDATGSGKQDIFTETGAIDSATNTYAYSLQMYLGNDDGTFGSALTPAVADNLNLPPSGEEVGQIAVADMNGDGKPDLVTLGTDSNGDSELAISLGNGDGTFQSPIKLDFAGGETFGYGLAVADFNGDGKVDVEVNGFNPPYDTGIFLGNGDGTVQTFTPCGGVGATIGGNLPACLRACAGGEPERRDRFARSDRGRGRAHESSIHHASFDADHDNAHHLRNQHRHGPKRDLHGNSDGQFDAFGIGDVL